MVTESYAEARYSQQRRGNSEMEPINAEVPQVARHCGQGKNKGADQERACRPIDAVGRNAKNHLALLSELVTRHASLQFSGRPRTTSSFVQV